ncbi:hypothetical protein FB451DRAFT_1277563 [Mycena latifolia]|nr:hypothetical protein FB451DRAFT_1277563 [Mycena latifolia]
MQFVLCLGCPGLNAAALVSEAMDGGERKGRRAPLRHSPLPTHHSPLRRTGRAWLDGTRAGAESALQRKKYGVQRSKEKTNTGCKVEKKGVIEQDVGAQVGNCKRAEEKRQAKVALGRMRMRMRWGATDKKYEVEGKGRKDFEGGERKGGFIVLAAPVAGVL